MEPPGDAHVAEGVLTNERLLGILKNLLANAADTICGHLVHKQTKVDPHLSLVYDVLEYGDVQQEVASHSTGNQPNLVDI